MIDYHEDPVARFISEYLMAVEAGETPPPLDGLPTGVRAEVTELLKYIATDRDFEADIPPIEEDEFAIRRGIVANPPPLVIDGARLVSVIEEHQLSHRSIAEDLSALGYTTDSDTVSKFCTDNYTPLGPAHARRLAAVVGVEVDEISARTAPWPASRTSELEIGDDLLEVTAAGHVVIHVDAFTTLAVVACSTVEDHLDALNFRRYVDRQLGSVWRTHDGALLVTDCLPIKAVIVDRFDCQVAVHTPTGDPGYSRLSDADAPGAVIADYRRRCEIEWQAPPALVSSRGSHRVDVDHIWIRHTDATRESGRKARASTIGKGSGYRRTADRLAALDTGRREHLLGELADATDEQCDTLLDTILAAS